MLAWSIRRLSQVTAAGKLHLKGMHTLTGPAVVARGPATFKAAVEYVTWRQTGTHCLHRTAERPITGGAVMGSDVVLRKLPFKQSWNR